MRRSTLVRALLGTVALVAVVLCGGAFQLATADEVFSEDWEAGVGNWYVTNGLWEVGVPVVGPSSAHSGSTCAGTVLDGNYPNFADTRLVSPQIALPGTVGDDRIWLKFWHWFVMENGTDLGYVQVSDDNGASWSTVNAPLFEGTSRVWTQACVDITEYAGMTVRLGFYFTSDFYWDYEGWYIDDVLVESGLFSFPIAEEQNFEGGIGDWGADNGLWEAGVPTVGPGSTHSGSTCAGTVLGGNYPNFSNTRLVSPRIALPGTVGDERIWLKFWHWFVTENGTDLGHVQVSDDNGASWSTVSAPLFEGTSWVWTQACVDITEYAGMTVQIGFYLTSDFYWDYQGWYIDDVVVELGLFSFPVAEGENFEGGIGDWGADNGLWEAGVPTVGPGSAHSGSTCAGTVLNGNYPNYANTRLVSPYIAVIPEEGQFPELYFWHWFWTENNNDALSVQIRTMGGEWQNLAVPGSPFSGDGRQWTQAYADLSSYADMTVQIGFYFTSDFYWNYEGCYIDDVRIEGVIDTPVETAFWATQTESASVLIRWMLASLDGVEGLNVYRSTSAEGEFVLLNDSPLSPSLMGSFEDGTVWPQTTFWYQLRTLQPDGSEGSVGAFLTSVTTGGHLATRLRRAWPNPSMGATFIGFDVAGAPGFVTLAVYDVRGRLVRRLWTAPAARGRHVVEWDGRGEYGGLVASGVYFVRLEAEGSTDVEKILVIR